MNRRSKLNTLLALTASLYLSFATPALAQNSTVIKLGWTTSDGAQDPYAAGARAFQSAVERETRGSVQVQLFPNRQLGDERQMLEGMRFVGIDLTADYVQIARARIDFAVRQGHQPSLMEV